MKVLHLVGNREDTGGILSVIRSLQAATAEKCRHVVWVNQDYQEVRRPGLDYRRSPEAVDEEHSHLTLLARALRALPGLRRLLKSETFDVVHGHTRGAFPLILLLAASGFRRCVFTNHTYANRTGMYRRASRWEKVRWVFLSPNMARHYGVTPKPGHIEIISACCSDDYFSRPLRSSRTIDPDRPIRLVGLGNIVPWKRWDLALAGLLRLPEELRKRLQFTIYGPVTADAPSQAYAASFREMVHRSGLAQQLVIAGPTDRVPEVLAESDWYVVLSVNEPCSVALMEALAGGMPTLVSASGGNVDIVDPSVAGIRFKTDDVEDLSACLTRMILGQVTTGSPAQIRETVRSRSASEVAKQYLRIYQELASRA